MIMCVFRKCLLNTGGIHSNTCFFVGKGNSSLTSLDKNVIQVAKSRLHVGSLILKRTQTSKASKPHLSQIKTEKVDLQVLVQPRVYAQVLSLSQVTL